MQNFENHLCLYVWKIIISKIIDHVNIIQIYVLHLCVTVTVCLLNICTCCLYICVMQCATVTVCLLNICTCCLYIYVMQCVTAGFDCVMTSVIITPCMLHYVITGFDCPCMLHYPVW